MNALKRALGFDQPAVPFRELIRDSGFIFAMCGCVVFAAVPILAICLGWMR